MQNLKMLTVALLTSTLFIAGCGGGGGGGGSDTTPGDITGGDDGTTIEGLGTITYKPLGSSMGAALVHGVDSWGIKINGNAVALGMSGNYSPLLNSRGRAFVVSTLQQTPSPTYIDTLGGTYCDGYDLNDAGMVVGSSDLDGDASYHGFVWDTTNQVTIDLGTLGGDNSEALAINNTGLGIVGWSENAADSIHATYWRYDNSLIPPAWVSIDLGQALGSDYSFANDINNNDVVTGEFDINDGSGDIHAFTWDATNGYQDIHGFADGYTSGEFINYNPTDGTTFVSGKYLTAGNRRHAFFWIDSSGTMTEIAPIAGSTIEIADMNANYQVVGKTNVDSLSSTVHAFIWDPVNGVVDLGTLPGGTSSAATGVNIHGDVIGWSHAEDGLKHAFIWRNATEGMIDLGILRDGGGDTIPVDFNNALDLIGLAYTFDDQDLVEIWSAEISSP